MRLTKKGKYAIAAMLHLAMNGHKKPISLTQISEVQKISLSYLEQLFSKLRVHNLVVSYRGPGGGYLLSKSPEETKLSQILEAVNEHLDISTCQGKINCNNEAKCITHNLWIDLTQVIHNYMSNKSLKDLINNQT